MQTACPYLILKGLTCDEKWKEEECYSFDGLHCGTSKWTEIEMNKILLRGVKDFSLLTKSLILYLCYGVCTTLWVTKLEEVFLRYVPIFCFHQADIYKVLNLLGNKFRMKTKQHYFFENFKYTRFSSDG